MRFLKRTIGIFISMIFIFHHSLCVFAYDDLSDPLDVYRARLSGLNHIFDTDYAFPSSDDVSYQDMVDFYQDMTMSEFDDHINSLHKSDVRSKKNERDMEREEIDIPDMPPRIGTDPKTQTQRYYYDKTNYLYVVFDIKTNSNGKEIYTDVKKTGQEHDHYPAYEVRDHSYDLYNEKRSAFLTFDCVRYLSQYLIDTNPYHFSSTFEIEDGDVSADVYDTLVPIQIEQNHMIEFDKMEHYPELTKNKIYIYCFETDNHSKWSLIDEDDHFNRSSFCVPGDGHYAIYMILQDEGGNDRISDIGTLIHDLISIKQYKDAEGYFRKTRKLQS